MSGFKEAVLSVFDFDRITAPLIELGDFDFERLSDAPNEQFSAWHVPAGCSRIEQGLLYKRGARESGSGHLRLVRFHGVEQRLMRSSQRSWDTGGIFDVDVFSTEVDRVYRRLQFHGWTALGDPTDYTEADFHVRQVVALGPDGFVLAIIQPYRMPTFPLPAHRGMTHLFNSTQMVARYDTSAAFYRHVLGWRPMVEFRIEHGIEPGQNVLGLPLPHATTADRHIGIFHPVGVNDGSIELIENRSMRGRDFSEHCVAPNIGLLSLRFPVLDARAYATEICRRGGQLYGDVAAFDLDPYGPVTIFSVRTPDGAILEFYELAEPRT